MCCISLSLFLFFCVLVFVVFRIFPKLKVVEEKPELDNKATQIKYDVFVVCFFINMNKRDVCIFSQQWYQSRLILRPRDQR